MTVYSNGGESLNGGKIVRPSPEVTFPEEAWSVTFDLYVPTGDIDDYTYIVMNGNSRHSSYCWVVTLRTSGVFRVYCGTQSGASPVFTTPVTRDVWQTWTVGWDKTDCYVTLSGGGTETAPVPSYTPSNRQEYGVLHNVPGGTGTSTTPILIRNVYIHEDQGVSDHQVTYLCNEGAGLVGTDTAAGADGTFNLNLYNTESIHSEDPAGAVPGVCSDPQPQAPSVTAPEGFTLTTARSGSPPVTVDWKASSNGTDWLAADDASFALDIKNGDITSDTLMITTTKAGDDGLQFRPDATNSEGTDTSANPATLAVATTSYPTSTFFGPVLTIDTSATLKWQWSSTGADPWYDVDDGVNGLDSVGIQATETGVEAKPGDPTSIQANNQLNIDAATEASTVYTHCKATTGYDEIFSRVNTLTIVEAP